MVVVQRNCKNLQRPSALAGCAERATRAPEYIAEDYMKDECLVRSCCIDEHTAAAVRISVVFAQDLAAVAEVWGP